MVKWLSPALLFAVYQCSLGAPPDSTTVATPPAPAPVSSPPTATETATQTQVPASQYEPMEEEFENDDEYPYSLEAYGDDDYEGMGDDDYFEDEGVHPVVLEDGRVLVPKMTWEVVYPSAEPAGDSTQPAGETVSPSTVPSAEDGAAHRRLYGYRPWGWRGGWGYGYGYRPWGWRRRWGWYGRRRLGESGNDNEHEQASESGDENMQEHQQEGMAEMQDNEHPDQMKDGGEHRQLYGYRPWGWRGGWGYGYGYRPWGWRRRWGWYGRRRLGESGNDNEHEQASESGDENMQEHQQEGVTEMQDNEQPEQMDESGEHRQLYGYRPWGWRGGWGYGYGYRPWGWRRRWGWYGRRRLGETGTPRGLTRGTEVVSFHRTGR
uniref:Uncharacterized protein n=1 Tax=Chromera velia CCMP2878 TaxID=1169474 RepID=A0A0G4I4M3_9ALVE|eukprot:Cvel_1808.t1-p1 / transcript=Cvel_1808.t1 / gene=Cvel_1808 / organism=Chromera_velia_CCMP2878 / gene_product=hypothetical protein / transcript_product=hypothetical protein / location=Cvel_scaffold66:115964-118591(-) / protein_length=376 / sequence_SO=supercontig / SO=protein_coding / is_pseudo=false